MKTKEERYLDKHFTVSDVKFTKEEVAIILRKYTFEQYQKRNELIKVQDELINFLDVNKMLLSPSLWEEHIKLSDKIEQLRDEIS